MLAESISLHAILLLGWLLGTAVSSDMSHDSLNINDPLDKKRGPRNGACKTVYETVTLSETSYYPATYTYTSTVTVLGDAVKTVTKYTDIPSTTITVSNESAPSATMTILATSTIYQGKKPSSIVTTTVTTYPDALTTSTVTEILALVVPVKTVIFTSPTVVFIASSNRYTGAPASLFLSVI